MTRDYNVRTDPSGSFIPNLDSIDWISAAGTDPIFPVKDHTYILENDNAEKIAECTVDTIISASNLTSQQSYLAVNTILQSNYLNSVFITDRPIDKKANIQVSKLVIQNQNTTANNDPDVILQFRNINATFEIDLPPYWNPYGLACFYYVVPQSTQANPFPPIDGIIVTINNNRDWDQVTSSKVYLVDLGTLNKYDLTSTTKTYGNLYGCAVDNNNLIYVVDNTNNEIIQITPGLINTAFGAPRDPYNMATTTNIYASIYNGLDSPTDITFDSLNNAYVANQGAFNIIKISPNGSSLVYISGFPRPPVTISFNTFGDNYLYVATNSSAAGSGFNDLYKCTEDGFTPVYFKDEDGDTMVNIGPWGITCIAGLLDSSGNNLTPKAKGSVIVVEAGATPDTDGLYQTNLVISVQTPVNDSSINFFATSVDEQQIISVTYNENKSSFYALNGNAGSLYRLTSIDLSNNTITTTNTDSRFELGTCVRSKNFTDEYAYVTTGNNQLIYYNSSSQAIGEVTLTLASDSDTKLLENPSSLAFTNQAATTDILAVAYVSNFSNGGSIIRLKFSDATNASVETISFTNEILINPLSITINTYNDTNNILYISSNENKIFYANLNDNTSKSLELNELILTGDVSLNFPAGLRYDSSSNIVYFCNKGTDNICAITNNNNIYALNESIYNPSTTIDNPTDIEFGLANSSENDYLPWLIIANDSSVKTPIVSINTFYNRDEAYTRSDVVRFSNGIAIPRHTSKRFIVDLKFYGTGIGQRRSLLTLDPNGIVSRAGPFVVAIVEDSECTCVCVQDPGEIDPETGEGVEYIVCMSRLGGSYYRVSTLLEGGYGDNSLPSSAEINQDATLPYQARQQPIGFRQPGYSDWKQVYGSVYGQVVINNKLRGFLWTSTDPRNYQTGSYSYRYANNPPPPPDPGPGGPYFDSSLNANYGPVEFSINCFEIAQINTTPNGGDDPFQYGGTANQNRCKVKGIIENLPNPQAYGERVAKNFLATYPTYQSGKPTEFIFLATNLRIYQAYLTDQDPFVLNLAVYYEFPTGLTLPLVNDYGRLFFDITRRNGENPDRSATYTENMTLQNFLHQCKQFAAFEDDAYWTTKFNEYAQTYGSYLTEEEWIALTDVEYRPVFRPTALGCFDQFKNLYVLINAGDDQYLRIDPDPVTDASRVFLPFRDSDGYDIYTNPGVFVRQLIFDDALSVLLTNRRAEVESTNFGDDFRGILGYRAGFHFDYKDESITPPVPYASSSVDLNYTNNQNIVDTTLGRTLTTVQYIKEFDVYEKYIYLNTYDATYFFTFPSKTLFRFVTDEIRPDSTDSYQLVCTDNGSEIVSNVFCNNCTYNQSKFLAGSYPVAVTYSTFSNNLYVGLQSNSITRVDSAGVVDNDYINDIDIINIKALLLDKNFDMYVLCERFDSNGLSNGYLVYIRLQNNIISVNATFLVNSLLDNPIDMAYMESKNQIYIIAGITPNKRLVAVTLSETSGETPTIERIGLDFGILYDIRGISSSPYNGKLSSLWGYYGLSTSPEITTRNVLYISNTTSEGGFEILRIDMDVSMNNYQPWSFGSRSLLFKPYTLIASDDGYLYINNLDNDSISKYDVTGYGTTDLLWATNQIDRPISSVFDHDGNLFVANAGTSPRNNRISRIWIHYFPFMGITLRRNDTDEPFCSNAKVYNITENQFIPVSWYDQPDSFPITIPEPIVPDNTTTYPFETSIDEREKQSIAVQMYSFYPIASYRSTGAALGSNNLQTAQSNITRWYQQYGAIMGIAWYGATYRPTAVIPTQDQVEAAELLYRSWFNGSVPFPYPYSPYPTDSSFAQITASEDADQVAQDAWSAQYGAEGTSAAPAPAPAPAPDPTTSDIPPLTTDDASYSSLVTKYAEITDDYQIQNLTDISLSADASYNFLINFDLLSSNFAVTPGNPSRNPLLFVFSLNYGQSVTINTSYTNEVPPNEDTILVLYTLDAVIGFDFSVGSYIVAQNVNSVAYNDDEPGSMTSLTSLLTYTNTSTTTKYFVASVYGIGGEAINANSIRVGFIVTD